MGQALYRKYRSKSLKEIVGQEHITKTLEQALKSGRISHAYLFTGPRGTGKTSIARILAHEVNGLPYTDDSSNIDIIEIDAASNRRIDEIRELRDKVYVAPTSAKYKVYIIDEVHMLTREAFNALLKTLEEPPAHVIFILATTDAHKLPATIISRTQRFTFKPAEPTQVVTLLKQIAKDEDITISDEALELLAKHGDGSFRDSVSLFDQASSHGAEVTIAGVLSLLGIPPEASLRQLVEFLSDKGTPTQLFQLLSDLYEQGYQATAIAKQLGQMLRTQLVNNQLTLPQSQTLALLRELIDIPASNDPQQLLEIVLIQAKALADGPQPTASAIPTTEKHPATPATPPVAATPPAPEAPAKPRSTSQAATATIVEPAPAISATQKPEPPQESPVTNEPPPTITPSKTGGPLDIAVWPEILSALKKKHNTVYSVVRMAQPEFSDGTITLRFSFSFHQKRLNEAKNRQLLADTIQQVTGQQIMIECLTDKNAAPYQAPAGAVAPSPAVTSALPTNPPTADLASISNIFGGGELLES